MKGPNKNPIVTINASPDHDPDLVAWLQAWADAPHSEATPDELARLAAILDKTPIKAPALFDIAHGFHSSYVAPIASLALYNAAANHAHQALIQPNASTATVTDILYGAERNRADLRKIMGSLVDPHGNTPQDFETLKFLYADIAQFTPAAGSPGYDPDLDAGGQAAMTGLAQYYTSTGQYDAADKILENADKKNVAPDRRATLEWFWAENCLASQHYQEAAPHLRRLLDDPQSYQPQMVWPRYIITLAHANNKKDANLAFDQWVRQFKPSAEQAAPVWEQVR